MRNPAHKEPGGQWWYLVTVRNFGGDRWRSTLAHEVKHVEQYRHGKRGSEPPCNAFAAWWVKQQATT